MIGNGVATLDQYRAYHRLLGFALEEAASVGEALAAVDLYLGPGAALAQGDWQQTGARDAQGLPGWVNRQTGEHRYQQSPPQSRQAAAPEQAALRPQGQAPRGVPARPGSAAAPQAPAPRPPGQAPAGPAGGPGPVAPGGAGGAPLPPAETPVTRQMQEQAGRLSDVGRRSLKTYTGNRYNEINTFLRNPAEARQMALDQGEDPVEFANGLRYLMGNMDQEFARHGQLEQPVRVYRGFPLKGDALKRHEDALQSGQPVADKAYVSTSLDPIEAAKYAGGGAVLDIRGVRQGLYMEPLTQNRGEKELMLPRGQQFRVVGIHEQVYGTRRLKTIVLEVI